MLQNWIWLATRVGVGNRGLWRALEQFGTPEELFFADRAALDRCQGLTERNREALSDKSMEEVYRIQDRCAQQGIRVLTHQDAAYPNRLRNTEQPPLLLYYLGNLPEFDAQPVIGVVGTRRASVPGLQTAARLGYQIAACGGIVISGLARGIDGEAMRGAVSAGQPVVGVLGGGVDVVYPPEHRSLFQDVARYGCLLSEYPPGTRPERSHFPERNRIISGLSLGVVVVEAPAKSGALITARSALEQGRDVFSVPGMANQLHTAGSNQLLKEGAIVAETGWDVMQEYLHLFPEKIKQTMLGDQWTPEQTAAPLAVAQEVHVPQTEKAPLYLDIQKILPGLTPDEAAIVRALEQPRHVDELVELCQLPMPRILASMTLLEVKGFVKRLPARRFSLAEKT